jgi:Holliday junction resolvase
MAGLSRNKGKAGERELARLLADLTGHDVRRRVRQHDGDDDLEGLPGWSIEAKRYKAAPPALVAKWWAQAVEQADRAGTWPVLFYRADQAGWRVVWLAGLHINPRPRPLPAGFDDTLTGDPLTWWRLVRGLATT